MHQGSIGVAALTIAQFTFTKWDLFSSVSYLEFSLSGGLGVNEIFKSR